MPVLMEDKKYARLLSKHLPAVIETDEELDRQAGILLRLTVPPRELTAEEERMVALLGHLVEEYERRAAATLVKRMTPVEVIEWLMAEHGLHQSDLAEIFGGQPVVSAVLKGKRKINARQARLLAARFGLRIETFLP